MERDDGDLEIGLGTVVGAVTGASKGRPAFSQASSGVYDEIYLARGRDYGAEAAAVHELVQRHAAGDGRSLLDAACGTGAHLVSLRRWYDVEGLDLSEHMLRIAADRLGDVPFHRGDMVDFRLDKQFDVLLCLFSSIAYVRTADRLREALENFGRHLKPGGVVVLEPWYTPETFQRDSVHLAVVDGEDRKVVRVNVSKLEGGMSVAYLHYLVADLDGAEHFSERHEMGLFTHEQTMEAFSLAGLDAVYEPDGLRGRGVYVGRRSRRS